MQVGIYDLADIICQRISNSLSFDYKELLKDMDVDSNLFKASVNQLVIDGYLHKDYAESRRYYLTASGQSLLNSGGYKNKIKKEDIEKQRQMDQIDSVISTNRSVMKTNKIIWVLTSISTIAAIVSAYSAYLQYCLLKK